MDLSILLKLLAVFALVGANGFFVAAEFALVSARRTRIEELVRDGDRLARHVQKSHEDLNLAISGCQLGITLSSLGLGWIGEPALATTLEGAFAGLPGVLSVVAQHTVAVAIAFAIITFLHIVLGELAPKTLALVAPETVSRYVAGPLNLFNRISLPFIWFLNESANRFLRLFGFHDPRTQERVHSPEEIQMLVRQSFREGEVESDEQEMIHGVFELTRTVARELMTPRTDIVAVPVDASLDEILGVAGESGFSRLPLYGESIDDIRGVVLVKDLLPWLRREDRDQLDVEEVARPAIFVPDTKPVDDLLAKMRMEKVHMAIVVDEFGGTDGIVTLEDLVEEIVGDIYDEHDTAEPEVVVREDGEVELDGGVSLSDLQERFDLPREPHQEEYDTVAGYVIGRLGRIPESGEEVELGPASLQVRKIADRRVTRLQLHLPPEKEIDGGELPPVESGPEGAAGDDTADEPGDSDSLSPDSSDSPDSPDSSDSVHRQHGGNG